MMQQQQQKTLSKNSNIPENPEKEKYKWYEHDLMPY